MRQLNKSILSCTQAQYSQLAEIRRSNEQVLVKKLKTALSPTFLSVQDTTLGANSCGNMYKIIIESPAFAEKSKVEQHKLVAEAISSEMSNIHGYSLKTRVPLSLQEALAQKMEEMKKIEVE